MLERLRRHLNASGLIPHGARVLVGYSGGPDSTCLLHLLHRLQIPIVAGHLHHGQRPEAAHEMKLCEAFCAELDVPFIGGNADVPKIAEEMKIGLEEAGRHARYSFFRQAAFGLHCDLIATGHTLTDHVETVLLNMTRGCGLTGIAGIPEQRENVVRPLLQFTREETRLYCESEGLWTHDDPSNVEIQFSRARLRHRVLPELRGINPGADAAIARLAEIAREEDGFLNGMAAAALEQAEILLNGELGFLSADIEAQFRRSTMESLPKVLFKRAVRLAFGALGASADHDVAQGAIAGIRERERGSLTAEGGEVVLEWDKNHIGVRQLRPTAPFRYGLTMPGETESVEFGWRFTAQESVPSDTAALRASMRVELDKRAVQGSLYFRTAKDGDQMQPLGFDGRRKLADLLSEAGLTLAARQRLPIVCDMIGPIWAPGVCLHERVRKREGTETVLVLEFGKIDR